MNKLHMMKLFSIVCCLTLYRLRLKLKTYHILFQKSHQTEHASTITIHILFIEPNKYIR